MVKSMLKCICEAIYQIKYNTANEILQHEQSALSIYYLRSVQTECFNARCAVDHYRFLTT